MPINQFTATTGRKKQSGAVDTINALAPGYLQSLYNKKQDAITQKGLDLSASQLAASNAYNNAQIALAKQQAAASKDQADTAAKIGMVGAGIQAASLLPESITSTLSGVGAKAYDMLGAPIVSAAKSLLGLTPAVSSIGLGSAAAALPSTVGDISLANAAATLAPGAEAVGLGNAPLLAALETPTIAAIPTTFSGALGTSLAAITNVGAPVASAMGVPLSASIAPMAALGALAPALPIAAGVYAFGQIMDQVLGTDPTEPWSPEVLKHAGANTQQWFDRANSLGIETPSIAVPMTKKNFDYYSTPQGHKEFRETNLAKLGIVNKILGLADPDKTGAQAVERLAANQDSKPDIFSALRSVTF